MDTLFFLERLGFADVILWMISFALIYGMLSQFGGGMPKSKPARAIIGIVSAFFVLMATPAELIAVISKMSMNLVLLILGLLVFIIFLEMAGVKVGKYEGKLTKTDKGPTYQHEKSPEKPFEKHPEIFAVILLLLAVFVFIGAGGLDLLGIQTNLYLTSSNTLTIMFFVVMILAVLWMVKGK